jgi:tetratricopeptide (TPR) repeat protein
MSIDRSHRTVLLALIWGTALLQGAAPVRVWEEPLVLPTYEIGKPDPNPIFDTGRAYQRAHAPVYPYAILDSLTGRRVQKAYKAVYLENRYVKLCVLPELGGRLFSALDKTNAYDFVYRQHVIKPGLVGMLGAWISGGIEWNVPHHHRNTTFMPAAYRIERHPDGSGTVWVGEMELRHRMKWLVGITLRPESSAAEIDGKVINRTPVANSFLSFANIAVHANPEYQIIFPPGTEFVTQHAKREFSRWPISDNVYNNIDFRKGVDVSMWKNHPSPISMFAWGEKGDFVAGYDHGKHAGTIHVGNRYNANGIKFFTWGNGREGQMWDDILSDNDGPYIELMAGAYSDNQPDYSWIQPYETKTWREYLYPVRQIGGVQAANAKAAVKLMVEGGRIRLGAALTSDSAAATVKLEAQGKTLLRETVAIAPDRPFLRELPLPAGTNAQDLRLSVLAGATELISYRPPKPERGPMPDPVKPPLPPARIDSAEQLYFIAQRLEQLHNPAYDAQPYYDEALRRDPADSRVNTAVALRLLRRGLYREAAERLNAALRRPTWGYTLPRDGEAYYYLGLALKAQGQTDAARAALVRAFRTGAWQSAASVQLAELESAAGNRAAAFEYLERAVGVNPQNLAALHLRAALRHRPPGAALEIDPLAAQTPSLEVAAGYFNAGLYQDAYALLASGKPTSPMWHYYLGYAASRCGRKESAIEHYRTAARAPADYCFPFRLEEIPILEDALAANPGDARAHYYLGELLFDIQPKRAIEAWEAARRLDESFALVHRNLALAYSRVRGDHRKAVDSMRAAIARNAREPRFFLELDQIQEAAGVAPRDRLLTLEEHQTVVALRDDLLTRELALMVQLGQFDKALQFMAGHTFRMWEGIGRAGIYPVYADAHLGRGRRHMAAGEYKDALADFRAALEYPRNLGTPKPWRGARYPEIHYSIGAAYEKLGDVTAAQAAFRQAVESGPVILTASRPAATDQPQVYFCLALALQKIGRSDDAKRIAAELLQAGRDQLEDRNRMDFFTPYGEPEAPESRLAQAHFAVGLAHLVRGERAAAQDQLRQALRVRLHHAGAGALLARMEKGESQ